MQKQCLDLLMYQEKQHGNEMLRVEKKPILGQKLRNAAWLAIQTTLQR